MSENNEKKSYNEENELNDEQQLENNEQVVNDNEQQIDNEKIENDEQQASEVKIAKSEENKKYGKLFLTVFLSFMLGATSVFGMMNFVGAGKSKTSSVTATKEDKDNQQTTVTAISKAKDAVVSVVNYQSGSSSSSSLESILRGSSESSSSELKPASSGSGVIYKKSGNTAYVVTNNHVIDSAKKLTVILSDGTSVDAELVGTDIWTDLAVLKISGDSVTTTMDFADSDNVAVGETAFAIGSPLDINLSNTVTKGIVSAVNRQIPMDIDSDGNTDWNQTVIQTDAAINPGNSGGALINNEGKLIGINESKIANVSSTVSAEGIGFVIPSNEVKLITEQLEKDGKVVRPALGVQLVSLSATDSSTIKGQLNYDGTKGAVVRTVESGSPASSAGLEKYDVITKLNDKEINDVADVRKYLFEKVKIGDTVKVTYYRDGKERTANVVVKSL